MDDPVLIAKVIVAACGAFVLIMAIYRSGRTVNVDTKDFDNEQDAKDYADMANKGMNK